MHKYACMPTPHLVPSVEVCKLAAIDRSTLSRHVKAGLIKPIFQIPGRTGSMLFTPAAVAKYLAQLEKRQQAKLPGASA
jgi:predicted site-specific integrase-resolvase